MLTNKIVYTSNISSNILNFVSNSSAVPNTLFELMKTNVLVVDTAVSNSITQKSSKQLREEK